MAKENDNKRVAEKNYEPEYYNSDDITEKGLAETHEQSNDTLTEGTIDAVIEDVNGKDVKIPRKGYGKK